MPRRGLSARQPPARLFTPPPRSRPPAGPVAAGREILSVVRLNRRIADAVGQSFPRAVWIEAEVSKAFEARTGHLFLTFAERGEILEGMAWASDVRHFSFSPKPGDRVRAYGRVKTYAGRSQYQIQITRIEQTGLGELLLALKERERRLEAEGLFAPERKRPLPFLPRRIGVLSARDSDALHDFCTHAWRRFGGVNLLFRDTPVQGPGAAPSLVAGLRELGRAGVEFIVVTRGGGSVEHLLPFSEESVIRAAAACPAPVVSAVGHEADRPLLDRVADYRVSTPTAAARELIPDRDELQREVMQRRSDGAMAAGRMIQAARQRWAALGTHAGFAAAGHRLDRERQRRREDRDRARRAADRALNDLASRRDRARRRLEAADPAQRLRRQSAELQRLRDRTRRRPPLETAEGRLRRLGERLRRGVVAAWVARQSTPLGALDARERAAAHTAVSERGSRSREMGARLSALDPLAVLERGYALALDAGGVAIRSAGQVRIGDPARLLLGDGELDVRVEAARPAEETLPTP